MVAFCDRSCNVIAPFVSAPSNRNESPLLKAALPEVTCIATQGGLDLNQISVSPHGDYDSRVNRKAIFNHGDKCKRLLLRFERISKLHYALETLADTLINLRHFCQG